MIFTVIFPTIFQSFICMMHIDYVELQLEFPRVCMTLLITTPAMYACSTLYGNNISSTLF